MKQIFKFILSLLIGIFVGFGGALIGILLFTDITLNEYFAKFANIELLEILGIAIGSMLCFVTTFFLQIILHEGGHLIAGIASGYRFVSFRILSFVIIRQKEKLCIKRFDIAGTGGQCLLLPPDLPIEQIPTRLYNLGGVLANLSTALLSLILFFTLQEQPFLLDMFLLLNSIIGLIMAVTNGLPLTIGGINNDGKNMLFLHKDLKSKQALINQLRINAMIQEGYTPQEMPAEWFETEGETDYKNTLQIAIRAMAASLPMERYEWEEAYQAHEEIMRHEKEIIALYKQEITCELVFLALVTGRIQRADELYTDKLQKYVGQFKKVMSSKQRLLFAIALFKDKNPQQASFIYNEVASTQDKYLMQGEVKMDLALMKALLDKEIIS